MPSLLREAMRRANEERPGSVHLELPEDVARERVCPTHMCMRRCKGVLHQCLPDCHASNDGMLPTGFTPFE